MTKKCEVGRPARQHGLEELDGVSRFLGFLSALTVALLTAASAPASSLSDNYAEQALQTLRNQTNLHPRAFVEDHKIRIYYTNSAGLCMLTASWKLPRATAAKFVYASAPLQPSKSPKPMPEANSRWHEATVLSHAESERLIHKVAEHIVPIEPGHGIFCRFALGEAMLYRDADGQVQIAEQTNHPANITIDRRYTRHEFASAAAAELETDLRTTHPGQTAFVLAIGRGNRLRLTFLDLAQKQAVVLYVPSKPEDQEHVIRNVLGDMTSIILVDNGFSFLKNPITSSVRTVNQGIQLPLTLLHGLTNPKSEIPPLTHAPGMDLAAWEEWLDDHAHAPREHGSLRLLVDGDQFYPAFERRVAEAQSGVDILVCIFDRDDIAVDMADRLKQRSTNIQVRVIFDRLMSRDAGGTPPATPVRAGFTPPNSIAAYLGRDSKVRARAQLNPAFTVDHTKLYLVDGRYAYIGGMNLGREYRYEWHDLMVEIQGPIVDSYQRQFEEKWAQVGPWGDLGLAAESIGGKWPGAGLEPNAEMIELRRLYTKNFSRQIRYTEMAAINRACSYIFVENPYLYSNEFINALVRARRRGVDVRVILPSENDLAAGHRSNLVTANYLREQGVRVYLYPGMTHVKALLVDGWSCIGSANFDALSLRLNREDDLATSNPAFAAKFRHDLFDADFARGRELQEDLPVEWADFVADAMLNPL